MAKMKIAKAMKIISRLKGEINLIENRLKKCVSCPDSNEYIENFEKLINIRNEKVLELIALKSKVMSANVANNKFTTITLLSELKNEIVMYKDLEIKQGIYKERYAEHDGVVFKTQLTISDKESRIETLQKQINDLTDDLDVFNASTDIEI